MNRNLFIELVVIEAVILVGQIILYYGCEVLQDKNNYHNVKRPIDDKIPQIPMFAFIYMMWFPMVALYPIWLFTCNMQSYVTYQVAIIISNICSTIIYLVHPTSFVREAPRDVAGSWLLKIIYKCDYKGVNCSPSLHCVQCFIVMMSIWFTGLENHPFGVMHLVIALLIVVSTVLTKQHCLMDVKTALPFAVASFALAWVLNDIYFGRIVELLI